MVDKSLSRRVLVIEDDPVISYLLTMWLEKANFIVRVNPNGQNALDTFNENEVDILLVDIMMPFMNGHEFIQRFRAAGYKHPVIIVSAVEPDLEGAFEGFGVIDWFQKPINTARLIELVDLLNKLEI